MEELMAITTFVMLIVGILSSAATVISVLAWVVRKITKLKKNEPELITIKDDLLSETPEDQWPEIPEEQW